MINKDNPHESVTQEKSIPSGNIPAPRILRILRSPVILCVLFVLVLIYFAGAIKIVEDGDIRRLRMGDYGVYLTAGAIVRDGKSPYKREIYREYRKRLLAEKIIIESFGPYFYSPHTAVAMSLFYSFAGASLEWFWITTCLIAIFSGVWLMARTVGQGDLLYLTLGLVCMQLPLFESLLYHGQAQALVFFSVALGLYFLFAREQRWGNIIVASGALAVGAVIKLMPLPLICWLLWRGYQRALLCTLIWIVALTLATLWAIDWFIYEQYYLEVLSGKTIHSGKQIFAAGGASLDYLLSEVTVHHRTWAIFIAVVSLIFTIACLATVWLVFKTDMYAGMRDDYYMYITDATKSE